MKFCKDVNGITHTKDNVERCFHFARLFQGILGPILPIIQFSLSRETLNIPLIFYKNFLVTKEKNSLVLPLLGTFWGNLILYIYTYIYNNIYLYYISY